MSSEWKTDPGAPDAEVRSIVGQSVKEHRQAARLSQRGLAEALRARCGLDWKPMTVANTERGKHPLELSELLALAAIFGVPVVDLVAPASSAVDYEVEASVSRDAVRALITGPASDGPDDPWPAADELLAAWQRED